MGSLPRVLTLADFTRQGDTKAHLRVGASSPVAYARPAHAATRDEAQRGLARGAAARQGLLRELLQAAHHQGHHEACGFRWSLCSTRSSLQYLSSTAQLSEGTSQAWPHCCRLSARQTRPRASWQVASALQVDDAPNRGWSGHAQTLRTLSQPHAGGQPLQPGKRTQQGPGEVAIPAEVWVCCSQRRLATLRLDALLGGLALL